MELRLLRSFIAAAEEGNISRAAQRLHLTQPALSRQIKALETETGVPLLERAAHSFKLTPAGEMLLREGRALVDRADALLARLHSTARSPLLRIGYSPSLSAGLLAPAMEVFSQRHPRARVDLADLSSYEMIERLNRGDLDLIVAVPPERPTPSLYWETVRHACWRVAVPRQHELAKKERLTPADLDGQRVVAYTQHEYPDYWSAIASWLKAHHVSVRVASEYDGINSLISAVEAGVGIALVVDRAACLLPERILLKPLNPQPARISISVGLHASRRLEPVLAVFVEELKRAGSLDEV